MILTISQKESVHNLIKVKFSLLELKLYSMIQQNINKRVDIEKKRYKDKINYF